MHGRMSAGSTPHPSRTSDSVAPAAMEKPLLRGVSHQIFFFVALLSGALLTRWAWAQSTAKGQAALVFGGSLALLLGVSAMYHRVNWGVEGRKRMRRLDHAAIFVLIAGGYTPLFSLIPGKDGDNSHTALIVVWAVAAFGMTKSLLWAHAPKWLTALLCVGLGWVVIPQVIERAPIVGTRGIGLLVVSGIIYSVGAGVYALKRPNPVPKVFGYHEVFHALVLLASTTLTMHVVSVLSAAQ
jgi:hemolysin III